MNQVFASYENQAVQEAVQGKPYKRSGRFNTTDAITNTPELRWPNEGLFSTSNKHRTTYDELTIPEWAAGQLTNIYNIQDPGLVKQALLHHC